MTMTSVPEVLDCQSDSSAREEMTQPVTADKNTANTIDFSLNISRLQQ